MLGLSDDEFRMVTELTRPLPSAARSQFLHMLVAELGAAGERSPATVRKVGARLQRYFLKAAPILGVEDCD
jgi:hypothetical protein